MIDSIIKLLESVEFRHYAWYVVKSEERDLTIDEIKHYIFLEKELFNKYGIEHINTAIKLLLLKEGD